MRYDLSAPDMSCGHCKMTIEKTLKALPVSAVAVDLATKRITLETSPDTLPTVLEALADEGFPASVVAGV